jgi:hypothetical protein
MTTSQEFMLLFRFTPDFSHQPTAEEMDAMHQTWGAYFGKLAMQEKLVSTHQLGFEGVQVAADSSVTEGIAIIENQTMSGNLIVRASSLAEATEIAKACPILQMGGNVEVRSTIPM